MTANCTDCEHSASDHGTDGCYHQEPAAHGWTLCTCTQCRRAITLTDAQRHALSQAVALTNIAAPAAWFCTDRLGYALTTAADLALADPDSTDPALAEHVAYRVAPQAIDLAADLPGCAACGDLLSPAHATECSARPDKTTPATAPAR